MKKVLVSAPGKLMLLGEHAVVYNRPCIVTAVGQRMFVTLELLPEPTFELEASDVQVAGYTKPFANLGEGDIPKGARFVEMAVKNFTKKYPLKGGVRITTKSEFSSLFGFGSSSASTVCVVKGLAELTNTKLSNREIFDIAAALYGGTLYFVTGGRVVKPVALDELPLVVGYTGVKADTVTLINAVAEKASKHPELIDSIYTQIGKMVDAAHAALKARQWPLMGELMNSDQDLLKSLGVSSQKIDVMIQAARDAGAWGAKLSGAGGGDCMIALVSREKKQAVSEAITKVGGQVIDVATNVEGVRIEL